MAGNEVLMELIRELDNLKKEVEDLNAQAGETDSILVANVFPDDPYNNQLVVRFDLTPPDGGQLYRFDETIGDWLQIT